jgi:hypothetical protein
MFKVEFHCHTIFSKDSLTQPAELITVARRKGLDRVIITDHNSIQGAVLAHELAPELVIVGEEIMTNDGELLAAYVQNEIPAGMPALEVIAQLRQQGAFISVSHPFDRMRKGHWGQENLEMIAPLVDAIEVFNARSMAPHANQLSQEFARQHQLAGTVGSDAHAAFEIGTAINLLDPFQDAAGLKVAVKTANFEMKMSPFWVHLYSRYAVWRKQGEYHG